MHMFRKVLETREYAKYFGPFLNLVYVCMKSVPCNQTRREGPIHGHLLGTAHKLSATKIEHSHWSTGHSTHL